MENDPKCPECGHLASEHNEELGCLHCEEISGEHFSPYCNLNAKGFGFEKVCTCGLSAALAALRKLQEDAP